MEIRADLRILCYIALIDTRFSGLVPFDDRDVVDAAVRSLEGVFFFGIGYWMSSTRQVMATRAAFAILLVGLVGHVAEVLLIHRFSLVPIRNVEITSSMALLAIGLLFVTLTPVAASIPERSLRFSQSTLGIYAVHAIFAPFVVGRISLANHEAEVMVQILCSVVVSFSAVYILSLWPRFRTFIR